MSVVVQRRRRPVPDACQNCGHYCEEHGSCRHQEPIGPRGEDGWPRTTPDFWCSGFVPRRVKR